MTTLTYTGRLVVTTCHCGIAHAMPQELYDDAQMNPNKATYCPLGHVGYYRKDTERTRLLARLDQAEADAYRQSREAEAARADADHQAAVARGYKGAMVQSKKRAAKGVCPVAGCRRHFVDVQRHVASKHPDWTAEQAS